MSNFDSTRTRLTNLLDEITDGRIQLPDFQRGWVWDDNHIRSLLVSIARDFPIGSIMLLETGGENRYQTQPVEGVKLTNHVEAERLILDGQQRLTALTQVLRSTQPVKTRVIPCRGEQRSRFYADFGSFPTSLWVWGDSKPRFLLVNVCGNPHPSLHKITPMNSDF